MSKLSNLFEQDIKIVEKRKVLFLIPICVIIFAIIMGVVFHFTSGSALNLGMDFTGGYTISVDVGAKLNQSNSEKYKDDVTGWVEGYKYTDNNGQEHSVKVSQILTVGTGDKTSLQVRFKSVTDDDNMEKLVDGIIAELEKQVTQIRPTVKPDGSKVVVSYDIPIESYKDNITESYNALTGVNGDIKFEAKSVSFTYNGALDTDGLINAMSIDDKFAASVYSNGKVGATVSQDLLYNALSAIIVALVLMLGYIALRFEFKSGIASIVALAHDVLMMFAFMAIFHIEFNSTFIAALITILGYSINSSIILFDRIRSNIKIYGYWDNYRLANTSIKQSFVRNLNTTITTLIMIGAVAVVCAIASILNPDLYQMVTFALPIIIGLVAGFYSSMFIAPSVWVSLGAKNGLPKSAPIAEANE